MIIVEGTDLVGKTTLCKKLADMYALPYRHMSKPGDGFDFVWSYQQAMERHTVQDRFHLGELAYGETIYGCRQTKEGLHLVEAYLARVGAVVIVVTASEEWLGRHLTEEQFLRRDEMFTLGQVVRVNAYFHNLLKKHWDPRVDIWHHLEGGSPYPAEDVGLLATIQTVWGHRQRELTSILARKNNAATISS